MCSVHAATSWQREGGQRIRLISTAFSVRSRRCLGAATGGKVPTSGLASRSRPDLSGRDIPMQSRIAATIWLSLLLVGCQAADRPMASQPAKLVCAGFVADIGTKEFADCVAYQESRDPGQSVPPYRMDQYNNRVDAERYEVDSMGRRMPVQNLYSFRGQAVSGQACLYSFRGQAVSGQAVSGQVILRDEYGNRYDSRGNRIK